MAVSSPAEAPKVDCAAPLGRRLDVAQPVWLGSFFVELVLLSHVGRIFAAPLSFGFQYQEQESLAHTRR